MLIGWFGGEDPELSSVRAGEQGAEGKEGTSGELRFEEWGLSVAVCEVGREWLGGCVVMGPGDSSDRVDLESAPFAVLQSLHGSSTTTHGAFEFEVGDAVIGEWFCGDGFAAGGPSEESPCGGGWCV